MNTVLIFPPNLYSEILYLHLFMFGPRTDFESGVVKPYTFCFSSSIYTLFFFTIKDNNHF